MAKEEVEATEEKKGRSKKKLLLPLLILLLGLGGGGYFMLAGKAEAKTPEQLAAEAEKKAYDEAHPELGTVVKIDPITMNLADGHVLKVGLALHFVKEPKDEHYKAIFGGGGHGAKPEAGANILGGHEALALDAAIDQLGDKTYTELTAPDGKTKAKEELAKEIKKRYHDDVGEVYYTVFVMS